MPREIITLQVGQCGNQIGTEFWKTVRSIVDVHGTMHADPPHPPPAPQRQSGHAHSLNATCRLRHAWYCNASLCHSQLCQEHGIGKDGVLQDFATQARLLMRLCPPGPPILPFVRTPSSEPILIILQLLLCRSQTPCSVLPAGRRQEGRLLLPGR